MRFPKSPILLRKTSISCRHGFTAPRSLNPPQPCVLKYPSNDANSCKLRTIPPNPALTGPRRFPVSTSTRKISPHSTLQRCHSIRHGSRHWAHQRTLADSTGFRPTPRRTLPVANNPEISTNLDIMVFVEECDNAQRSNALRRDASAGKLAELPPETLAKLISEGAALGIQLDKKCAF